MNNLSMIGNLGKDPELRYSNEGTAIVNFSVAVKRQFKNKSTGEYESDWFNCTAFKNTAEMISNNFKKGSKIAFTGSIQNNNYTNKEGVKIYGHVVMVQNVTFVESKNQSNQPSDNNQNSRKSPDFDEDPFEKNDDPITIDDDSLPF
ncbi:single-stranded DNA-binding protein [Marinilactibacillus psychrotolerans]|uniref:single-stranded DNA-binding protein n=1 Tax=Marinilactibacillus psychrotolerans TaxID=191770 RepID=UPI001C7D2D36|nr:single-stranded DNA-binding protein [Marinilactibacillus psychrotolerans]GEQ32190.1 single-stranded DNA-binding protein [Marinilactibacillus psychrotolerans]